MLLEISVVMLQFLLLEFGMMMSEENVILVTGSEDHKNIPSSLLCKYEIFGDYYMNYFWTEEELDEYFAKNPTSGLRIHCGVGQIIELTSNFTLKCMKCNKIKKYDEFSVNQRKKYNETLKGKCSACVGNK